MSFLSNPFVGPDYPYAHRWGARVVTVMITLPFIPVAYFLGYGIGLLCGDEIPSDHGVFMIVLFLAALTLTWTVQWSKGFRQ